MSIIIIVNSEAVFRNEPRRISAALGLDFLQWLFFRNQQYNMRFSAQTHSQQHRTLWSIQVAQEREDKRYSSVEIAYLITNHPKLSSIYVWLRLFILRYYFSFHIFLCCVCRVLETSSTPDLRLCSHTGSSRHSPECLPRGLDRGTAPPQCFRGFSWDQCMFVSS